MHGDARWRFESRGAAVAEFGRALHEEFHVLRADAPFVLKRAARPQRAGLLIFGDADALAFQVFGLLDPRILAHQNMRVEEAPRGENRQRQKAVVALRHGDDEGGERHFRHVEICVAQLPPEQFGGADDAGREVQPFCGDAAVEHGAGARVFGKGDAKRQFHPILPNFFAGSASIGALFPFQCWV